MAKYYEKSMTRSIVSGLSAGEFAIVYDRAGNEILAVAIAREDRKSGLINFTATVSGKETIEDTLLLETGFYPVKKGGRTRLAFVVCGEARFVPSAYAHDVRLSGGLIDLDTPSFMKEMKKAADHLAAENRKLLKEVKDLRKSFDAAKPSEYARQKAREEVQINSALGKVSDEDDDALY